DVAAGGVEAPPDPPRGGPGARAPRRRPAHLRARPGWPGRAAVVDRGALGGAADGVPAPCRDDVRAEGPTRMSTPVVARAVDMRCSAAHAFTVFTDRIADWWPLGTHSFGAGMDGCDAVSCVVEPAVGGRIYEVLDDGRELEWGRVVAWEPGARVALDWNPSL